MSATPWSKARCSPNWRARNWSRRDSPRGRRWRWREPISIASTAPSRDDRRAQADLDAAQGRRDAGAGNLSTGRPNWPAPATRRRPGSMRRPAISSWRPASASRRKPRCNSRARAPARRRRALAAAQVKQAEATLNQRDVDVAELTIRSPISGQVTTRVAAARREFQRRRAAVCDDRHSRISGSPSTCARICSAG